MTTSALFGVRLGPSPWNECLPSTSAKATSEMTKRRIAWLKAPTIETKLNATIFRRRERRPSVRKTESTETFGAFPVLGVRVLEKGFFTGPVSAAGDAPVRASRNQIIAHGGGELARGLAQFLAVSGLRMGSYMRDLCTLDHRIQQALGTETASTLAVRILDRVTQSFPEPERNHLYGDPDDGTPTLDGTGLGDLSRRALWAPPEVGVGRSMRTNRRSRADPGGPFCRQGQHDASCSSTPTVSIRCG